MDATLNLIEDPWIPTRHRGGNSSWCRPWDLFAATHDPVVSFATTRPDLDGGIAQLVLGLLQTVVAPEDDEEWADRFAQPPAPEELRRLLAPLAESFELLGDGPRAFQDRRLRGLEADPWPVEKLLIDLGLHEGVDHFARTGSVPALCLPCGAAALVTLQSMAPSGGRGHFTSLRGGGPLTTLLLRAAPEATLWQHLWLNVLPASRLRGGDGLDRDRKQRVLPWLLELPADEPAPPLELTPLDADPLQAYFAMPRRLWLGPASKGACGLCGAAETSVIATLATRPNGIRYTGAWRHPLSPYRNRDGQLLAVKGDESGVGYRHWLGLALGGAGAVEPALPVSETVGSRHRYAAAGDLRLWAFGYAMSNMKALAWNDARMPVYPVEPLHREAVADLVRQLAEAAGYVHGLLRIAAKKLIAARPGDVKADPVQVSERFWSTTEGPFYELLAECVARAPLDAGRSLELRGRWRKTLARRANAVFDLEVEGVDFRAADPAQVAGAWNDLQRSLYGRKLATLLGLPSPPAKPKNQKRKGADHA